MFPILRTYPHLVHGSISTTLNIYAHVLAEHLEQFEQQRAKLLGILPTKRALETDGVAEVQQVAQYQWCGVEQPGSSSGSSPEGRQFKSAASNES
jgi:hypothetical protein